LDYLNVMESAFGKWSKRLVPPVQSLVHLYQEAQEADKLKSTLARLQQLYTKNKPDPNDEFFRQAISYTSSLPTAKGNQKGPTTSRMMVQLDDNYFRILILSEQVKQAYQAQEHKKAEKLCLEAIKEFAQNPAKSTFLEFLISIYVNMEKWDSVADTLQQLIDMHPELSSVGQYNLEPHVALFRKFTTLSPSAQSQLKRVYAQLAGPTGLPSANINRLQSLVNNPADGGPLIRPGTNLIAGPSGGLPTLNLGAGPRDVMDDLPPIPGVFNFEKMTDNPQTQHLVSDDQKAKARERALQMSKELDDILLMLKQRKKHASKDKERKERKLSGEEDDDEDDRGNEEDEEDFGSSKPDVDIEPKIKGNDSQGRKGKNHGKSKKKQKQQKQQSLKKPLDMEELLRTLEKNDGDLEEEDKEEENVERDEPLTFDTSSNPSSTGSSIKKLGYIPGSLNKCGNITCDKKEQTENQFKLCSRCKKACYCTIECQRKAWRKHKTQCQKL